MMFAGLVHNGTEVSVLGDIPASANSHVIFGEVLAHEFSFTVVRSKVTSPSKRTVKIWYGNRAFPMYPGWCGFTLSAEPLVKAFKQLWFTDVSWLQIASVVRDGNTFTCGKGLATGTGTKVDTVALIHVLADYPEDLQEAIMTVVRNMR